jgi:hypothetical protein
MKTNLLLLAAFAAALLSAQNQPVLGEEAIKVSDNVWAIMGFPNVAIIVGNRATLVVDTGLGPANGSTIARVVANIPAAAPESGPPAKLSAPAASTLPSSPPTEAPALRSKSVDRAG